jgi:superfamily II DNA/RNA helicase
MEELKRLYNNNIYEIYNNLKKSGKTEYTNNDLWKLFEYYSCIKLMDEYNKAYYHCDDIDPKFKEENNMTQNDTGIDLCDLDNTIVQCKMRKTILNWQDCATFFGSQNIYDKSLNKIIIRWSNLIIARNSESKLSTNLLYRNDLFIDKTFSTSEILEYCKNIKIISNKEKQIVFELRDYQKESINIIKNNKNAIICLPTGTGKNTIIIYSLDDNKRYLILVPRIILMEQFYEEIIKYKPHLKNKIGLIGNGNNKYDNNKNIIICVFNSISLIQKYAKTFEKIYIDEAHHVNVPEIYTFDNENDNNCEDESYIDIIKTFKQYNNNVYLSATIDPIDGFIYYKKDIREMIEKGYLCDYTINIPIFNEDPTNINICKYLIENHRHIIVYCNSKKEGKKITEILNLIQNNCANYIDCDTSTIKRNNIIKEFKNGNLSFLVNVRILVEGFDAPISQGVCFLHMPYSQTTLIQIIGRALRLHNNKTYAKVIIPYSSNDDEKNINIFMKIFAKNDTSIRKSYENKKLGGYININNILNNNDVCDVNINEIFVKYEKIYNSLGGLLNDTELWNKKLEEVKKYIELNNKRPSKRDNNIEVKKLGKWLSHQITNYNNKTCNMKSDIIRKKWEDFKNDPLYNKYFLDNDIEWENNLDDVKNYIDLFEKRPNKRDTDLEIKKLGKWLSHQITNYNNKVHNMKSNVIRKKWEDFKNDPLYNKYF